MALNKFMHPRNIYRTPPEFSKLAEKYTDFANITKKDVLGKVCINFKDPKSLRILTKCLLHADFGLNVEIPEDRLVPTLPLRMNYILWIEDLLNTVGIADNVVGLDIGTGACAIYPLLAAVNNKWRMVGTESDEESFKNALRNVQRNNLENLITLKFNPDKSLIEHLFTKREGDESENQTFSFCMCNPPFYSNVQELCESRSIARPPPKNAFTGSPQELITEGGELEFIRKLIAESKAYSNKILLYTTMVGHKYNLRELIQDLQTDGIRHAHTEFCQGRVTRWGLVWTHQPYDDTKLVTLRDKTTKKATPIAFLLPPLPNIQYDVETLLNKLRNLLKTLNITHKIINKRGTSYTMEIVAQENTWSNQRRKRRLMKRLEMESKKPKCELETSDEVDSCKNGEAESTSTEASDLPDRQCTGATSMDVPTSSLTDKSLEESGDCYKNFESEKVEKEHVVRAVMKVFRKQNGNIILEMEFISGSSGKEGAYQIVQYIKNNWK